MILDAWGWCTETTQRDGTGREEGRGFRMGSTCIPVADSCRCVRLFATPWTVAYQAPLSMGFSRQEYWLGLPFPSPEDLPDPGIKPRSPALEADTLTSEIPGKPKVLI